MVATLAIAAAAFVVAAQPPLSTPTPAAVPSVATIGGPRDELSHKPIRNNVTKDSVSLCVGVLRLAAERPMAIPIAGK